MKCLTICQPWPAAIFWGHKRHENRTWSTDFRGRLLLHAGKSSKWMTPDAIVLCRDEVTKEQMAIRGAILGFVNLVSVQSTAQAYGNASWKERRYISGPFCLHLVDPVPFPKPIPFKGRLGLFEVPDDVVAEAIARTGRKVCA